MTPEDIEAVTQFARALQRSGDLWGWDLDPEQGVVELFTNIESDVSSIPPEIGGARVVVTPLPAAKEQEVS